MSFLDVLGRGSIHLHLLLTLRIPICQSISNLPIPERKTQGVRLVEMAKSVIYV